MPPCYNTNPLSFTTIVYKYLLTVLVDILAYLLGIPITGIAVMNEDDFMDVAFNKIEAIQNYTLNIGNNYPSMFSSGHLPDDLKVLHFYITRFVLPCSHGLSTIYPIDLWIMAIAKENRLISYPHLMFNPMIQYYDDNYNEALPFAPQITLMLRSLGLDIRFKVSRVNRMDTLRAQFVLRKVDALVGRRHPRVNASKEDNTTANVVPLPVRMDLVLGRISNLSVLI
ncbi:unnamed protein product [Linum trigynum]|uniref:Uncharacterized protein n=1 Tax=Linum trigynum TaxID=586398 RepID=A0AAV2ECC0_9ROSI